MEGVLILKKIGFLLVLALFVSSIVGCESKQEPQNTNNPTIIEDDLGSDKENTNSNIDLEKLDDIEVEEDNKPSSPVVNEEEKESGRIYYYEGFSETNYYSNIEMPKDDEQKLSFIVDSLKNLPNNDLLETVEHQEFTSLPKNLSINSVEFKDDLIKIDFSSNFTSGLGSSGETSVLESLLKTIEYNFGVNKVIITFNNENYSSGHIEMEDGEWFTPNSKNSVELKGLRD